MNMNKNRYIRSVNMNEESEFPFFRMVSINEESYPRNMGFHVMHWHDDLQLIHVREGSIILETLSSMVKISKGESVLIRPGVVHNVTGRKNCCYYSYIFPARILYYYPNSPVEHSLRWLLELESYGYFLFDNSESWANRVNTLLEEIGGIEETGKLSEYRILFRLSEVFLLILENGNAFKRADPDIYAERVLLFLKYIDSHYAEDITLEMIAAAAQVSKSECIRCFRKTLKRTPYDYLTEYRLSKASYFLEFSNDSIMDISLKCGFSQPSHFGFLFKKRTGMTPRQYRISCRNAD